MKAYTKEQRRKERSNRSCIVRLVLGVIGMSVVLLCVYELKSLQRVGPQYPGHLTEHSRPSDNILGSKQAVRRRSNARKVDRSKIIADRIQEAVLRNHRNAQKKKDVEAETLARHDDGGDDDYDGGDDAQEEQRELERQAALAGKRDRMRVQKREREEKARLERERMRDEQRRKEMEILKASKRERERKEEARLEKLERQREREYEEQKRDRERNEKVRLEKLKREREREEKVRLEARKREREEKARLGKLKQQRRKEEEEEDTKCVICKVPDDVRDSQCPAEVKRINKLPKLPTMTVIFTICNEPKESLYYSINSVFERTPRHLLKEIVIVDDGSSVDYLRSPLEEFIRTKHPHRMKLVRQNARTGLMRARVAGAKVATGDVICFLDSHISPQRDWAEPLLARIGEDRHHVVMPYIDGLSSDGKFTYQRGGLDLIGFNTQMQDHWMRLQKKDEFAGRTIEPQPSAAMAGGLFALDRKFFWELGGFDEKMEFWGGENIEMSMRLWMCGGTLELVPCSRVAHIFGGFPNPHRCASGAVHGGVNYNKWRAIRAWMQPKHIKIFEKFLSSPSDIGSLDNMFAIKKRLKCKNFDWYLENVWPESWILKVLHAQANGSLRNEAARLCLSESMGSLSACNHYGLKIFHSREHQLMLWKVGDLDNCMAEMYGSLQQTYCNLNEVEGRQQFKRNSKGQYVNGGGLCLTAMTSENRPVRLMKCDSMDDPATQRWEFVFPKL